MIHPVESAAVAEPLLERGVRLAVEFRGMPPGNPGSGAMPVWPGLG